MAQSLQERCFRVENRIPLFFVNNVSYAKDMQARKRINPNVPKNARKNFNACSTLNKAQMDREVSDSVSGLCFSWPPTALIKPSTIMPVAHSKPFSLVCDTLIVPWF